MTPAVDELPLPRQRVAICICTYQRPTHLGRLLERLELVARDADALADVVIVIADDDPAGSAAEVTGSFVHRFPLGLHHLVSASGNIAVTRNRVLELGLEHGDWLTITDDDCMPDEDWLRQLLVVQREHQADAVSGCCVDEPPVGAPPWLSSEPFLDDFSTGSDGMPIEIGALKNTLVSADFLRRTGIRFDAEYGLSGGEDAMFFYTTHEAGLDLRYAAHAIVREKVPPERAPSPTSFVAASGTATRRRRPPSPAAARPVVAWPGAGPRRPSPARSDRAPGPCAGRLRSCGTPCRRCSRVSATRWGRPASSSGIDSRTDAPRGVELPIDLLVGAPLADEQSGPRAGHGDRLADERADAPRPPPVARDQHDVERHRHRGVDDHHDRAQAHPSESHQPVEREDPERSHQHGRRQPSHHHH